MSLFYNQSVLFCNDCKQKTYNVSDCSVNDANAVVGSKNALNFRGGFCEHIEVEWTAISSANFAPCSDRKQYMITHNLLPSFPPLLLSLHIFRREMRVDGELHCCCCTGCCGDSLR